MDLYRVLGASPDDSAEALHRAYRRRARELHPDVSSAGDEEAMRELNDAWAVLGDPELRAEYDEIVGLGVEVDPRDIAGVPPRWVRRAPLVAILAVLLAIFVLTAYAAVPMSGGR